MVGDYYKKGQEAKDVSLPNFRVGKSGKQWLARYAKRKRSKLSEVIRWLIGGNCWKCGATHLPLVKEETPVKTEKAKKQ